ncbi:hypothetical protein B0H10DRAFT_2021134 [Mycena sp. CBHHK59/15]|nr:hypothetical protein B0H10DRAFT_2021134 [Mycena sp. CBHHK59/15]
MPNNLVFLSLTFLLTKGSASSPVFTLASRSPQDRNPPKTLSGSVLQPQHARSPFHVRGDDARQEHSGPHDVNIFGFKKGRTMLTVSSSSP